MQAPEPLEPILEALLDEARRRERQRAEQGEAEEGRTWLPPDEDVELWPPARTPGEPG